MWLNYRPTEFRFLFIFRRQKAHFLFFGVLFFGRKRHSFSFLFFGTKIAVKTTKKRKSVLWLSQCTAGRTLSHLQSQPAAVYIATRRAWVVWGSKHWADSVCCLCCCSRLVPIAPPASKILVGATNKCCQQTAIQCRWTDLFWSSK